VGIGTTSPAALVTLDIKKTGDTYLMLSSADAANKRSVVLGTNSGGSAAYLEVSQDKATPSKTWVAGVQTNDRFFIGHPGENEKVTILSGGNVGIGATNPDALLHLNTTGTGQLALHVNSGPDGKIRFDGGDRLTLEILGSDSTLLLGKITGGQSDPRIDFYSSGSGVNNLDNRLLSVGANYAGVGEGIMRFLSRIVEIRTTDLTQTRRSIRLRIDDGGDPGADSSAVISLNKSDSTIEFSVDSSVLDPGTQVKMKIGTAAFSPSSAIYAAADGKTLTTTAPSSILYKKNVRDKALDPGRIFGLQVKSFQWETTGETDIGFVAEEVKELVPELYSENSVSTGWRADRFPFYLFEALKELRSRVEELSANIDTLKPNAR
jgi:hypothetical protein